MSEDHKIIKGDDEFMTSMMKRGNVLDFLPKFSKTLGIIFSTQRMVFHGIMVYLKGITILLCKWLGSSKNYLILVDRCIM